MSRRLTKIGWVAWTVLPLLSAHWVTLGEWRFAFTWVWLMVTGAVAAAALARAKNVALPRWAAFAGIGLVAAAFSFEGRVNVGSFMIAVGRIAATVGLGVWVARARVRLSTVKLILYPASAAVLAGSFAAIFARKTLFFELDLLGSVFGSRNVTSVFLALAVPFFLLSRRVLGIVWLHAVVFVIVANRTRSAWVMLIVYGIVLLALALKHRRLVWPAARLASAVAVAALLVQVAPNRLRYTEDRPYLRSLETTLSLSHTSGRDELWSIGADMIRARPVRGFGAGNFRVFFGEYLRVSKADTPSVKDPIAYAAMNEYLQAWIETGPLGTIAVVGMGLGVPLVCAWSALRRRRLALAVLSLGPLALGIDAIADFPFQRGETLALSIVTTAALWRCLRLPEHVLSRPWKARAFTSIAALACVFCACIGFARGVAYVWTPDIGARAGKERQVVTAYHLWPYEPGWFPFDAIAAVSGEDEARRFVVRRLHDWPSAVETLLAAGAIAERDSRWADAAEYYATAMVPNPRTRFCDLLAFGRYEALINDPRYRGPVLPASELAACAPPSMTPERGSGRDGAPL